MGKILSRRTSPEKQGAQNYTPSQIYELRRCAQDPTYFIDTYLSINRLVGGPTPMITRDYQRVQLLAMGNNSLICIQPRRSGATIIPLAFQFWEALFRAGSQHGCAFVHDVQATDGIRLVKAWHKGLPSWLSAGIKTMNTFCVEFDNGSRIVFGRINDRINIGRSWSTLFADSMAHANNQDQEDFWHSAVPSLVSSGRIFMMGCPNGPTNMFAELYDHISRSQPIGNFLSLKIEALHVYSQTELDQIYRMIGGHAFRREFECEFIA